MNFFEHQDRARQKTWRLIVLFGLSIVLIILAINLVVHFLFFTLQDTGSSSRSTHPVYGSAQMNKEQALSSPYQRAGVYVTVSLAALALIGLASVYRITQLRGGGDRIAMDLGGIWVDPDSADPQLQRLCNVVEEMSLASGVPIPHLYVLNEEKNINALAAGYSYEDAVIVISRGALDRLTRDELQGVIAHEFTHILNGDMRMNIRMMGLLFGILVISETGRFLLYGASRGRSGNKGKGIGVLLLLGLALWILGYIGVFFGRLIRAGVSRQREFLADASAVQFTRNPAGIAGALKKIGAFTKGSHVKMSRREEVSHMFFAEGQPFWLRIMATHPPLVERIRAIEPSFQPADFAQYAQSALARPERVKPELAGASAFTRQTQTEATRLSKQARPKPAPPQESVGYLPVGQVPVENFTQALHVDAASPDPERLDEASLLLYIIPDPLLDAARRREQVEPLLFALLLGLEPNKRDRKMLLIWNSLGEQVGAQVKKLLVRTDLLTPSLSLALVDLAAPTLRTLPTDARERLVELMEKLLIMNNQASLLGYCFVRLLRQRVKDIYAPAQVGGPGKSQPAHLRQGLLWVFSVLAMHGHESNALASQAFARGITRLLPQSVPAYVKPADWAQDMDKALTILDQLSFSMKEQLIQALLETASYNGNLSLEETALLRLICACLHVPVPPVVPVAGARLLLRCRAIR